MTTTEYAVTGMTCSHCEQAVTAEVGKVAGVAGIAVDVAAGRLTVTGDGTVDPGAVVAAVAEAGYQAAPRAAGNGS